MPDYATVLPPEAIDQIPATPETVAPTSPPKYDRVESIRSKIDPTMYPVLDASVKAAEDNKVDPNIYIPQLWQESKFDPDVVYGRRSSSAGAQGLNQFMPPTAKGLNVNPLDPYASTQAGAKLMATLLKEFGGDYPKALAAYNAGPMAVLQANGVPDYPETKAYIAAIMGQPNTPSAATATQPRASAGTSATVLPPSSLSPDGASGATASPASGAPSPSSLASRNLISNQFDYANQLSPAEVAAACGPTAALAFARFYGRDPTIAESMRLAKQVGWTPSLGMAGPNSEVALLGKLGVTSTYDPKANAMTVAQEVQAGRPVIVDTPNHYYAIDSYNPQTGQYHVGGSGLALRGGSDWMTWTQIGAHGGGTRGAITVAPQGDTMGGMQDAGGNPTAAAPAEVVSGMATVANLDAGAASPTESDRAGVAAGPSEQPSTDNDNLKAISEVQQSPNGGMPYPNPGYENLPSQQLSGYNDMVGSQPNPAGATIAPKDPLLAQAWGTVQAATNIPRQTVEASYNPAVGTVYHQVWDYLTKGTPMPKDPNAPTDTLGQLGASMTGPASLWGGLNNFSRQVVQGWQQSDPNQPLLNRIDQATKLAAQPYGQAVDTEARRIEQAAGPNIGPYAGAAFKFAAHTATDPLMVRVIEEKAAQIGVPVAGLLFNIYGHAAGMDPQQIQDLTLTGMNIGTMAPTAESLVKGVGALAQRTGVAGQLGRLATEESGMLGRPGTPEHLQGAEDNWTRLQEIASQAGIKSEQLAGQNSYLDQMKSFMGSEGSAIPDLASAHDEVVATAAPAIKEAIQQKIGQLQEETSAFLEAYQGTDIPKLYNRYFDKSGPRGQGIRPWTVEQWQDTFHNGNRQVQPDPHLLVDARAKGSARRIDPVHFTDRIVEDAAGIDPKADINKTLEQYHVQKLRMDKAKGEIANLKNQAKEVDAILADATGTPRENQGTNARGTYAADVASTKVGRTDFAARGQAANIPMPARAKNFLESAKGTPEEQLRIQGKIKDDAQNESDVLLKHYPEELRPYVTDVAGQYGEELAGRRRGVVHDDEAAKSAVQAASGMSLEQLMRTPAGKAFNNEEILAIGSTVNNMLAKLDAMKNQKAIAQQVGRGWSSYDEEQMATQALQAGAMAAIFRGSQAEAGRALRAFRSVMAGETMINVKAIGKAAAKFGIKPGEYETQGAPRATPDVGGTRQAPPPTPNDFGSMRPSPEGTMLGTAGDQPSQLRMGGVPIDPTTGQPFIRSPGEVSTQTPLAGVDPTTGQPYRDAVSPIAGEVSTKMPLPGIDPTTGQPYREAVQPIKGETSSQLTGTEKGAIVSPGGSHEERLEKAFEAMGTNVQEFRNWMEKWSATSADDVAGRFKLLAALENPTLMKKINEVFYNGILSAPPTHVANFVSNSISAALDPLERLIAAGAEIPLATLQGRSRQRFFHEVPESFFGMVSGFPEGLSKGLFVLKNGFSLDAANRLDMAQVQQIKGPVGNVINMPSRFLNAADQLWRSMLYSQALHANAYRMTRLEGWQESEFTHHLADLIANPTPELFKQAGDLAEYRLFRQKPGEFTQALLKLRNTPVLGIKPLVYVVPFIQTPVNLFKFGMERSPLGILNPHLWQNVAKQSPEASDQLARWAMGSAVSAGIVTMFARGDLTGPVPTSPSERDAFYRQGKQPWSIKIGDKYISYQKFEPFVQDFVMIGSVYQAINDAKAGVAPEVLAGRAVLNMGANLASQQYLSGLSNALNAWMDPERYGGQFIEQLATGAVPFSSLGRMAVREMDPTVRTPSGVIDAAKLAIPGLSGQVPAKLNAFGETSQRETNPLSPYTVSTVKTDPLETELARLKIEPGYAGKAVAGVNLSPDQQRQYQVMSGQEIKKSLADLVASPTYQSQNDVGKSTLINSEMSKARNRASVDFSEQMNPSQMDPMHQAARDWDSVPKYAGIKGTPEEIRSQNRIIAAAKQLLVEYKKKFGPDLGEYRMAKENKDAYKLTLYDPTDSDYLKAKHATIDKKYGGALTQAEKAVLEYATGT